MNTRDDLTALANVIEHAFEIGGNAKTIADRVLNWITAEGFERVPKDWRPND